MDIGRAFAAMELIRYSTNDPESDAYRRRCFGMCAHDLIPGVWHRLVGWRRDEHHWSGISRLTFKFDVVEAGNVPASECVESLAPPGMETPPDPIPDSSPEDAVEAERMAYHEAGHAVLRILWESGIEIIVIESLMAHVSPKKPDTASGRALIEVNLAGGIAQRIFKGVEPIDIEVRDDLDAALRLAGGVVAVVDSIRPVVEERIRRNWVAVEALARALIALPRYKGRRQMLGVDAERIVKEYLG